MKNILRCGINSNMLKTIAIIAMVIDHIGFYFSELLPNVLYIVCRYVGRIAMPIFVYTLVQGFFHTKNFKKYLSRISIFAVVTQILITIVMFINIKCVPSYISAKQVYMTGNILFSLALALIVLKLSHENVIIKKWTNNKNFWLKMILIIVTFLITIFVPIDYGTEVLILGVLMYYVEKIRIQMLIEKSRGNVSVKNVILNSLNDTKLKNIYLLLILFVLSSIVIYFNASWLVLVAIVPIALYNGERGKINMKYIYYIIFPLQHILLYSVAMLVTSMR